MEIRGPYKPTWNNRRKVIFLSLLFCAAVVIYTMFEHGGSDSVVAQTLIISAFGYGAAIVWFYITGNVKEDKAIIEALGQLPTTRNRQQPQQNWQPTEQFIGEQPED